MCFQLNGSHYNIKCQTPLHGHRLQTCTTPPTEKLTTILFVVQQNLPHRNARAQHLDMSRCWDVAGRGKFFSVGSEFVVQVQQVVELL